MARSWGFGRDSEGCDEHLVCPGDIFVEHANGTVKVRYAWRLT